MKPRVQRTVFSCTLCFSIWAQKTLPQYWRLHNIQRKTPFIKFFSWKIAFFCLFLEKNGFFRRFYPFFCSFRVMSQILWNIHTRPNEHILWRHIEYITYIMICQKHKTIWLHPVDAAGGNVVFCAEYGAGVYYRTRPYRHRSKARKCPRCATDG